mmetsp:Transcript_23905/g.39540  ORF Transcript_23905/g.39540 Transcript_23905/m.39540 type:complete len:373 (-) Transcript_23905:145-1263(-)
MYVSCAVVEPVDAEELRRQLDRDGWLCTSLRAFKSPDGTGIALPLKHGAKQALQGKMRIEMLAPPVRSRSFYVRLRERCLRALRSAGIEQPEQLLLPTVLPHHWEKLGDVVLLASGEIACDDSQKTVELSVQAQAIIWAELAASLGASRVGIQGRVDDTLRRKSGARIVWPVDGGDGWTLHREMGISYGLDVTRSMFSSGNGTEKVVDLYAGIGYFTLPYLVHARAKHLHACEWDDDALAALRYNIRVNQVAERCTIHTGDNACSLPAFAGEADRVNLGLIPSSEAGWPVAVAALRPNGGRLHVHANVDSRDDGERRWLEALQKQLEALATVAGREWMIQIEHIERVKWYAPHIRHVVADVLCALRPGASIT